jgi:NAD(P)-dependent dehydrogenase (short-subunit alcohol dehydrogenase family)
MPTVLITGTSTGIGRAATEVLAQRGWQVFATMRDLHRREPLERTLKASGTQDHVEIVALDLNDPTTIETAVARILSRTGGTLDAVVHNAGVSVAGALEGLPLPEIRRVMETNFFGVLELTRAILPAFRAERRGRVVMISSEAAFIGQPANSIYCASKWALEGWAESLAYEVEPFGIKVILIEPGPCRTQIWHSTPRIQPPGSPYLAWVKRVFQAADAHAARSARDPREVALVIADALEARRPRFRYPVGPFARLNHFLRGKLPSRLMRRGVSRYLGLPTATQLRRG